MEAQSSQPRYRFGVFEANAATGELRRQGMKVRLGAQPLQVLFMLLETPGDLLTRDEIAKRLWPDGTFVDFEHGVNSAVNRIREAIGDTAANPRFVETLARRGYRFVAPVERIEAAQLTSPSPQQPEAMDVLVESPEEQMVRPETTAILATAEELPQSSYTLVRTLFLALQCMYLAFYLGLLLNLPEVNELLSVLPHSELWLGASVVSAAVLIPARIFLIFALLFRAPDMQRKYLKLWPLLLILDVLWALSPFLLLHHVSVGVALACTALLVYAPFAQRSLVLMGAADAEPS